MGKLKNFFKRINGVFTPFGGITWSRSREGKDSEGVKPSEETLVSGKEQEGTGSEIVSMLFDDQSLPRLVTKWRDKILGKVKQLQTSGMDTVAAKKRLASYLRRLAQERERYVQESRQQIKRVPDNIRKQHPEGGLPVELGVAGTVFAFADHIKASEALLEALPKIIRLCGSPNSTIQSISDGIKVIFDDLLFQIE